MLLEYEFVIGMWVVDWFVIDDDFVVCGGDVVGECVE